MKHILVISTASMMCGVQSVLVDYLKIMHKFPNYKIDLVYMMDRGDFKRDQIPKDIHIQTLLNPIETEFFIYTDMILKRESSKFENQDYYLFWRNFLTNKVNQQFLEKINGNSYDAIIVFNNERVSFDAFLEKYDISQSIPIIRWIHSNMDYIYWNETNSYVLNKHQHIFAICGDMQQDIQQKLSAIGVANTAVHAIYNPLDIDEIIEKSNVLLEADKALLADDFIVQVSRLHEGKNHLQLINIFAKLKQKGIKEKLYILGEGESEEHLRLHIRQLGLEKECLLLGKRDNPFPFMKHAKLFVHTARYEGLPTTLIESMVCGTPIVAMDCPTGPREILADGRYGELVPLYDEEQFVEKTFSLLNDEQKYQYYVSLLPEATARFSMDTIQHKLFEKFNQIIGVEKANKKRLLIVQPHLAILSLKV